MRLLDLFSGIGGFSLAASWVWGKDLEIVGFCDNEDFAQKVLTKNFPGVPIYGDIKEISLKRGAADIITGGFPCQPFSQAGKRQGEADDRHLWPEMLRIIKEVRPRWIIGENVYGLVNMENGKTLDRILADLEDEGYTVEPFIIPACAVGAWHRRDRIWIVAYSERVGCRPGEKNESSRWEDCDKLKRGSAERKRRETIVEHRSARVCKNVPDPDSDREERDKPQNRKGRRTEQIYKDVPDTASSNRDDNENVPRNEEVKTQEIFRDRSSPGRNDAWWTTEPSVGRVANGIPNRVDRLKGLGNAIVPQVAAVIMQAIKDLDSRE